MTPDEWRLLGQIFTEDGPIRILVYRSVAAGRDEEPRYIAQSLRYGQTASGREPAEALRRVVMQVVAYLSDCLQHEFCHELRDNWAPSEVLQAFSMARPFQDIPDDLAPFFETKHDPQFRDREMLEVNELRQPLESLVERFA
ncbi:MAG: hypothetical protein JXQ73_14905 [Phycisphaerae bacterium]|nr:hypothetical protein [Phycisphaerae bacterium]